MSLLICGFKMSVQKLRKLTQMHPSKHSVLRHTVILINSLSYDRYGITWFVSTDLLIKLTTVTVRKKKKLGSARDKHDHHMFQLSTLLIKRSKNSQIQGHELDFESSTIQGVILEYEPFFPHCSSKF